MSRWSSQFRSYLTTGGEPMYAVDFVTGADFRDDRLKRHRYILHSHGGPIGDHHIGHAVQRVTSSGQSVSLRTWRSSAGGLSVDLSGADVAQFVARAIPRGMMAQLKIGFEGMPFDQWGAVGLYQFRGLSGSDNSWRMDFNDALSALQATPGASTTSRFMYEAGETTTLTSPWNTTDVTMAVDDTDDFERDDSAGARGLLYCQPTTGDPFYLKWSGKTSNQFTVDTTNVIGTTRVNMASGDTVTSIAYAHDIVPDVRDMILFGGLAGASTMPTNWSMGINYHGVETVNAGDLNEWRARWLLYADFEADFFTSQPLENPYRGLEEFLAKFGTWLVIKEGALSWRFVQAIVPFGLLGAFGASITHEITDQDIASEQTYSLYNSDCPVEYYAIRFAGDTTYHHDGPSTTPANTDPAQFVYEHESSSVVFDEGTATSNRANGSYNTRQRLAPWYTRIPDSMKLVLSSWKFADLVPGDVVSLKSDYIYNMINGIDLALVGGGGGSGGRTHDGTPYMVTAVDVDWDGFTVNVELSTPPYSETRF